MGGVGRTGESLTASQLYEIAESASVEIPGLHEPSPEKGMRQIGTVMARVFKDLQTVNLDGFTVERKETPALRKEGGTYLSKTYTVTKSAQAAQPTQDDKSLAKQYGFSEITEASAPCASRETGAAASLTEWTKAERERLEYLLS